MKASFSKRYLSTFLLEKYPISKNIFALSLIQCIRKRKRPIFSKTGIANDSAAIHASIKTNRITTIFVGRARLNNSPLIRSKAATAKTMKRTKLLVRKLFMNSPNPKNATIKRINNEKKVFRI